MNPKLNSTSWGELDLHEPDMGLSLLLEDAKAHEPYQRQYGKSPEPTWFEVGALSFVCMVTGLLLGMCI